jgi:chemotaxis protein methyltransferase CheR
VSAELLRRLMPRLGLEPRGYRNVRRTVLKRLARRTAELGLAGPAAYETFLEAHPEEWSRLDAMCRIPISRLWRDRAVYDRLAQELLPARAASALAAGREVLRVWSAGCASGEEPCSAVLAWEMEGAARFPDVRLEVVATDADPVALARAARGVFAESSFVELPAELRARAASPSCPARVRPDVLRPIHFVLQDLRRDTPDGAFDLILCRNLAFTYFDAKAARAVAERFACRLEPGGYLVVGRGEQVPDVAGLRRSGVLVHVREGDA